MSQRVIHFEIPADDPEGIADFYRSAFGWKIEKWSGPQPYWLVQTGEMGPGIDGGILVRRDPFTNVANTVSVENLEASSEHVRSLGGTLVGDNNTIPGVGYSAYARDPEGNLFQMLQADEAAK